MKVAIVVQVGTDARHRISQKPTLAFMRIKYMMTDITVKWGEGMDNSVNDQWKVSRSFPCNVYFKKFRLDFPNQTIRRN